MIVSDDALFIVIALVVGVFALAYIAGYISQTLTKTHKKVIKCGIGEHDFDNQSYRLNGIVYHVCLHCNVVEQLFDNRLPTIGFNTIGSAEWKLLKNPSLELIRTLKKAQGKKLALNNTDRTKEDNKEC